MKLFEKHKARIYTDKQENINKDKVNLKDILNKLKESGIDIKLVGEVTRAFNYSYVSGYEDGEKVNILLDPNRDFVIILRWNRRN